jgi:hypothetical protein
MKYSIPSFSIPFFSLPSFSIPETPSEDSGLLNETIINFEFYIYHFSSTITPELYKYISDKYGIVYHKAKYSLNNTQEAVIYIAKLNNVDAKIDLLKPIRGTQKDFNQNKIISNLYPAVNKLNNHVLDRTGTTNINDWLYENNIKVIRDWANLCEQTGMTIDEENIDIEN